MKTKSTQLHHALNFILVPFLLSACGPGAPSQPLSPDHVESGSLLSGELFHSTSTPSSTAFNFNQDPDSVDTPPLRERMVEVNTDLLSNAALQGMSQPTRIAANLFEDTTIEVALEEVQFVNPENFVITGRVAEDPNSAVSLVMNKGTLVGNIHLGGKDEVFEIRAVSGKTHTIREVNPDTQAGCETEDGGHTEDGHQHGLSPMSVSSDDVTNAKSADLASPLASPTIDVLVAYTPAAETKHGGKDGIEALIQMGIADTNRAFKDSGVNAAVRLVGMMKTNSSETGNFGRDLKSLQGLRDGKWDEVHTERARLGADQVSLVGAYSRTSSPSGIGYYNARYSSAFTVTKTSAFNQFTFSHELGHNLGLDHANGYQSSSGRFRTIIAYGNYPRIRRYSNPSLRYNGHLTGSRARNEASILNRNAARIANLAAAKQ